MQLGWSLPLVLDSYAKRALEPLSGVDYGLGNLTFVIAAAISLSVA